MLTAIFKMFCFFTYPRFNTDFMYMSNLPIIVSIHFECALIMAVYIYSCFLILLLLNIFEHLYLLLFEL